MSEFKCESPELKCKKQCDWCEHHADPNNTRIIVYRSNWGNYQDDSL